MIKLIRNRFIALTAVVACLLAMTACDDYENPRRPSGGGLVKIKLNIDTGKNSPYSRGAGRGPMPIDDPNIKPEEDVAPPNGYENGLEDEYENISTLRVIILHNIQARVVNGTTQTGGIVEVNKLVTTAPDGTPMVDKLEFVVENNETKRIYLIANEDALPSPVANSTARQFLDGMAEKSEVNISSFEYWAVQAPTNGVYITDAIFRDINKDITFPGLPLTERFSVFVSGQPITVSTNDGTGLPTLLDTEAVQVYLFLTRAAAKATFSVEVPDDYYGEGVALRAIRINNLNSSEYVFPRGAQYYPPKYYLDENEDSLVYYVPDGERYITDFTTNENTYAIYQYTLDRDMPLMAGYKLDNLGPIYFPESKGDVNNKNITVDVLLTGTDQWLTAKPLGGPGNNILTIGEGNNAVQAIARNTHVKIAIKFGEAGDITWRATVAPYNTVSLNPSFGFPTSPSDPTDPNNPGASNNNE